MSKKISWVTKSAYTTYYRVIFRAKQNQRHRFYFNLLTADHKTGGCPVVQDMALSKKPVFSQ